MKKSNEKYDFGLVLGWMNGYWIAGTLLLGLAIWILIAFTGGAILPLVLILFALNLYAGNYVWRKTRSERLLTLPFTDLLSSDQDVVLDACCGTGRSTIAIGKVIKNGRIVALDKFDAPYWRNGGRELLEENLKIANLDRKVEIVTGNVTRMDFEDNQFDAIVSTYAIDHLKKQKLQGLQEI